LEEVDVLNKFIGRSLSGVVMAILCLQPAWADTAPVSKENTAHAVVEQVTVELTTVVKNERDLLDTDPGTYFSRVKSVLEPVVDFGFIARNVMGSYWEEASESQRERFVKTFKDGLVETYAKGMANYIDLDIIVLPPSDSDEGKRRVGVVQEITGPDGTNRVSYTMAQNRDGEWKLINMVLNGVNLGKTFRNQFAQAAKQNDGDLDAVISNWSAES
jgi:phospholipid transport system substrate-binding protein